MIPVVDPGTSIRLVLEARLDRDSITGALRAEHEEPLRFSGWLGLVAAIDAAARQSRPCAGADAPRLGGDLLDGRLEPLPKQTPVVDHDANRPSPTPKGAKR